jgi:hypothetical protein
MISSLESKRHESSPLYNFVVFWIFFCEKFLDRPSSNPETNPNPVSKQAGGKHIKVDFFTVRLLYDFGAGTVAVKSLLWLGILVDSQILAPVYSFFLVVYTEKLMKSAST